MSDSHTDTPTTTTVAGTCAKNQKKKTQEQLTKMLRSARAPPCRFHFFHIIELLLCGDDGKEKQT